MDDCTSENTETKSVGEAVSSHFWVCSYPYFSTTLFVSSPYNCEENLESLLYFHDADGELVNEASMASPANEAAVLELDQFMGACKLESGIKHGHLVIKSPPEHKHFCRMHTGDKAAFLGEPICMSNSQSNFFPLLFGEDRSNLLCLVNYGQEDAKVKCRLFRGKRTPELTCEIPAMGARVYGIEAEFAGYSEVKEGQQKQAYLRLSSRATSDVGIQLLERINGDKKGGIFTSLT